jgi:alpha-1,3-rhamnosyl/mannosyltransferase
MRIGAAVVCAETTSLPETIGDRQFLFDPRSVDEIAAAMTRLANDDAYRDASVANGRRRLVALNQQNVGAHYEALWRKATQRDANVDCAIHRMSA